MPYKTRFLVNACNGPSKIKQKQLPVQFFLDPCSCTSYFTVTHEPGYIESWHVCSEGLLWDHVNDRCDLPRKVDCDRVAPWNRCQGITDKEEIRLKRNCLHGDLFPKTGESIDPQSSDSPYKLLPRKAQLANAELGFTSMIAGGVITLMIIGIVMELCNCKPLRKYQNTLKTVSSRSASKAVTHSKEHVTEAVEYEYIDEHEAAFQTDISPEDVSGIYAEATPSSVQKECATTERKELSNMQEHQSKSHLTTAHENMVPKTKSSSLKREKGGKTAKPPRPPTLQHSSEEQADSVAYIHPV